MSEAPKPPQGSRIRLAHISDIHVASPDCPWTLADYRSKRLTAWLNLRFLGRGQRFRFAERVLQRFAQEIAAGDFDGVLFSGDATALGFEGEMAHAARLLRADTSISRAGLAVPGNHDYLLASESRNGCFERHFARWQEGERVDDGAYPFARRFGPTWCIGVNTARPNRWAWDASGAAGPEQLERLRTLLHRLDGTGPRILVTHYPIWLANGKRETKLRALRDLDALVDVCVAGGVSLWLHGHRHHSYVASPTDFAPFPVICIGSGTQEGRWTYGDYTIAGDRLQAVLRQFDPETDGFRELRSFELQLPVRQAAEPVR